MKPFGELCLCPSTGVVDDHHGQVSKVAHDDYEPRPSSRGLRGDIDAAVIARVLNVPVGLAGAREGGVEPVHQSVEPALGLAVIVACGELEVLRVVQRPQQLPQPVVLDSHGPIVSEYRKPLAPLNRL